ncbi:MAG: hypothetical protein EHM35_19090 [Planctomycetaceae bacterium]|nr:MAG: hypothetical protein EHM35_19090 [Planctomycetaceae bacterium]
MPKIVAKAGPIPQPIFGNPGATTAAQTPPPPPTPTPLPKGWYFAEGSTKKPFDTWLLLQNPDPAPANVKVTYMLPKGGQQIGNYLLKPTSRTSLFLNTITPDAEVSALVESDREILAERAMYFNGESHDTAGSISPSSRGFFAEVNTRPGYDTWMLLQNPNTAPVTATLTFYKEDGSTVTHKMLIPHVSRESLLLNLVVPDSLMGTRVEADRPIIAERAVYNNKKAGASSIGATDLSKTWYMAEGNTRNDFDTWLLMMNPGDAATEVTVTYMPEEASVITKKYTIAPRSRFTVNVDQEVPNARVAARGESAQPIVVERSVYFADGAASHNSVASALLSKLWYLPEGSTAKPFTQYILLANPGDQPANTTVTFMKEDGSSVEKKYTLRPASRFTIEVNPLVPDTALSTKVVSDQPIVAERSMYFNDWKAGHNAMGIPK